MPEQEEWITLRAAALRVTGKSLPCITVKRWAEKGVYDIVLDYKWIGGRRYTTINRMEQFVAKVKAERWSNGKE